MILKQLQLKTIITQRLVLRTPKIEDASILTRFIQSNKGYFEKWEPIRISSFYTNESQLKRIAQFLTATNQVKFYIFRKEKPDQIIGEIGLSNIVRGVFQNCNLAYKLDEKHTGQGYMKESLRAVIEYVFEELELHRIEANIIPKNNKSINLIKKLGFEREGLSKKLLKINGEWQDHYRYALLNEKL